MKKILRILAVTLVLSLWGIPGVQATTVTLSDFNSTAIINADSQQGMYNWAVDGVSMLYQQWFWYRIGSTGGEKSIDTLSAAAVIQPTLALANLSYSNRQVGLSVEVTYSLLGAGSGSGISDIGEQIRLRNLSTTSSMTLHFFQYSDFDLGGVAHTDTVTLTNTMANQSNGSNILSETVVTPPASRFEAGLYATTLNSLNDGNPTTLNNNAGPTTGDATWAYEWDITLGPGGSYIISKDKHIAPVAPVPEPGTLLLLGAGLVGLGILRRKS